MTFKSQFLAVSAFALSLTAIPAFAGDAETAARAHIDAIAKGDVAAITGVYAEGATLHWVGGPLDGTYNGAKLNEVWTKFTKAQGMLQAGVANLHENANPAGATVTANVVFEGKNKVPVTYVMMFRGGKLVDEIWQISPNMSAY